MLRKDRVGGSHHVGVTRKILPMARPAFSKSPRTQKTVDHLFTGVWSVVFHELPYLLGFRGKTCQVKAHPAQPDKAVGIHHWLQRSLLKLCQHKTVHRVHRPGFVFHGRNWGVTNGLKCPEFAAFLDVNCPFFWTARSNSRVGCAQLHPLLKYGDFICS